MRLLDETLRLLHLYKKPLLELSKEADLPLYWLRKLKEGSIRDPSVNRIQKLYEYLSSTTLL